MAETEKRDYRQELTDALIAKIEAGTAPWQKPFDSTNPAFLLPVNPTTGKNYRGGNTLQLLVTAEEKGFIDPRWATFKQAQDRDWQVRKGEKGTSIEYWKFSEEVTKKDESGKPVRDAEGNLVKIHTKLEQPRVFRAVVFNLQQMNGAPAWEQTTTKYDWTPIEKGEAILAASGADIRHDQFKKAFYSPSTDSIHLPQKSQFRDDAKYYGTALHELGHWTGHESRLDRNLSGGFGSESYAREELRAELASYFLAARTGIPNDPDRHASYLQSWIRALKDDKNEIYRASRDAEYITEYVLELERKKDKPTERTGEHVPAVRQHASNPVQDPGNNELALPNQQSDTTNPPFKPNPIPQLGTPAYMEYIRQSNSKFYSGVSKELMHALAKDKIGEQGVINLPPRDKPVSGEVIAATKLSFLVQTGKSEALHYHNTKFTELPTVGQFVLIKPSNHLGQHDIELASPELKMTEPRFRVLLIDPKGQSISRQEMDETGDAMRSFVKLARSGFGDEHGPGSYAALMDQKGKLDSAWTSEGHKCYKTQYGTDEARELFEKTEKEMLVENRNERAYAFKAGDREATLRQYPELKGAYQALDKAMGNYSELSEAAAQALKSNFVSRIAESIQVGQLPAYQEEKTIAHQTPELTR